MHRITKTLNMYSLYNLIELHFGKAGDGIVRLIKYLQIQIYIELLHGTKNNRNLYALSHNELRSIDG
jgi:hypothetical protein